MLAGIATATEASAIGAVLALGIVIFRGRFEWGTFRSALHETARTSAMILFIVVGATAFTGVFNITGGLRAAQELMRGLDMEPWMLIAVMMFIVFALGMFLDWTGIVLLSFPIFLPIVQEMGVSELWFVVLTAVVLQTSFLSPPFGYALFYLRALAPPEVRTSDIIIGVLPFIGLIRQKMDVIEMESETDYRQHRLTGQQVYFTPAGATARAAIDTLWDELTGHSAGTPLVLEVQGRRVEVPKHHNSVARASFWELCGRPLGPADYLALAEKVRVLILEDIPMLSSSNYNEAKRFVTLIDALYEGKVRLIASAADEPERLYAEGAGAFEFERTASRLREMQAADWGSDA